MKENSASMPKNNQSKQETTRYGALWNPKKWRGKSLHKEYRKQLIRSKLKWIWSVKVMRKTVKRWKKSNESGIMSKIK